MVTFADDRQVTCRLFDMANLYPDSFAESKSTTIHHIKTVAVYWVFNSIDQPNAITVIKNLWQPTPA